MQQLNETFLNRLIRNHYRFAAEKTAMAICNVGLGVSCLFLIPIMLPDRTMVEPMAGLASVIFAGLGVPTIKEGLDQRQQARNLEAALPLYQVMQTTDIEISQQERALIQATFLELVKKTTLS